jgi:hypothetical protein
MQWTEWPEARRGASFDCSERRIPTSWAYLALSNFGHTKRAGRVATDQLTTTATSNPGESSTSAICRDLLRELCWRAAQQRLEIVDQMRLIEISQIKSELPPIQLFAGI